MHILITNDDGIHAEGLRALRTRLSDIAKVTVIAPDRPRSACSHSITLHKPLRVEPVSSYDSYELNGGGTAYLCNGTPSDCVMLAVEELLEPRPDLVVSGINLGPNLGDDVTYSGTVAAAMEATILGIRSFAISMTDYKATDFSFAADFARRLALALPAMPLPDNTFLNVDIPNLPASQIQGYEFTQQGHHRYLGGVEKRCDLNGRVYYWRGGEIPDGQEEDGTDVAAIAKGKVSITPLQIDLTNRRFLSEIRNIKFDLQ